MKSKNYFRTPAMALGALLCAVLAACGGGGGTSDSGENIDPSTVAVSGVAYKGILKNAQVVAYEVVNGVVSSTPLKTVLTGVDGSYTLNLSPTSNPVVLEVKNLASTTMLDESSILTDGSFKEVAAEVGATMRSFVTELTQNTSDIMINPGTEKALVLAEKTFKSDGSTPAGLTGDVLTLAKTKIRESFDGTDPFSTSPPAKASEIASNAVHATILGLAKAASSDANCALKCQIESFSGKNTPEFTATLTPGNSLQVSNAAAAHMTKVMKDATDKAVSSLSEQSTSNSAASNALSAIRTAKASVDKISENVLREPTFTVTDIAANQAFEGFIDAMRSGVQNSKNSIEKETDRLKARYDSSVIDSMSIVSDLVQMIQDTCMSGNTLGCISNNNIKWTGPNLGCTLISLFQGRIGSCYTFSGTLNGHAVSGGIQGEFTSGQKAYLSLYDLSISKAGKKYFETVGDTTMNLVDGRNSTTKKSTATVNGSIKAYDQAASADGTKFATVTLKNVAINYTQTGNTAKQTKEADGSINGELSVTLDTVTDKINGTISAQFEVWNESVTVDGNTLEKVPYVKTMNFNADAVGDNKELSSLTMTTNTSGRPPKGDNQPLAADNFSSTSTSVTLSMVSGTVLKSTYDHSAWNLMRMNSSLKTSDGKELLADAVLEQREKTSDNDVCETLRKVSFCSAQINVKSSDGTYTSTLKQANDKVYGNIYKGTTKVGEIIDGVVYANGKKISLY